MSQNDDVLALLREHPEGITPRDAMEAIGTMRLAARIAVLRAAGYGIGSEMVKVPGRSGPIHVARYFLLEPERMP